MAQNDALPLYRLMMRRIRKVLWAAWAPLARRAARAYVAGPELNDALRVSDVLAAEGYHSTICPWHDGRNPSRVVTDSYLSALQALDGSHRDCYLSIKAPNLGYSRDLLGEIMDAARPSCTAIHFDSLGPEEADATWALIEESVNQGVDFGCTLPARWRRSLDDVDRAVRLGLRVRIVKGQWEDPGGPIDDIEESFLRLVRHLAGRAREVAIATHDPALAAEAFDLLRSSGSASELELLFGLPVRNLIDVARGMGLPIRFYVPYGQAWLPYSLSQLPHHPHMLWWTFRDWMRGWHGAGAAPWRIKSR